MRRTRRPAVATLAVVLVLTACTRAADGDGDGAAAPAPTGSSTTSTTVGDPPPTATSTTVGDPAPSPTWAPPVNPYLADSPWPMPHQSTAQQASSALPGPEDDDVTVQLVDFTDDAGIVRRINQASPFLVLGGARYDDAPGARAVWGATLTDLYKYVLVDGRARYVDHEPLRRDPFSINWNLLTLADGRVVVASPLGSTLVDEPCRTDGSALLAFTDGDRADSPITCVAALRAGPDEVAACRGLDGEPIGRVDPGYSVTGINVTFSGEILTYLRLPTGPGGREEHYVAVAEPDLSAWADCTIVSTSEATNNMAVEPLDGGGSAVYVATATSFVKLVWDPDARRLERRWERAVPLRTRTGTTPTLIGHADDGILAVIDAPCAVVDPFRGTIRCSDDDRPARVVAVRRDDADDTVLTVDLPEAIRTVENSPSARGDRLVVAAYGGYDVDPDVRGVAAVDWDPEGDRLEVAWFNPDVQMNGVTSISEASGLVYSSGATPDGAIHLAGIRVWDTDDGPGGELVVDIPIVGADEVDRAFDQGNSTVIAEGGTVLWATREGFVVVSPR